MSTIPNAAPIAYLRGINDQSRGVPIRNPEELPTHLPHFYLYAEQGPTEPTYCDGDALASIFGSKTLDPRYPYFNHQSLFASTALGEGNAVFIQRVIPTDAGPKARILLSADIVADDIIQYQRAADGSFLLDSAGAKIPITGAGATLPGHKVKWVLNSWTAGQTTETFGAVSTKVGTLTNSTDEQSTLYPIMEFEVESVGEYGNNIALRIVAPTTSSEIALNSDAVDAIKAYIYRLVILRRASAEVSPSIVNTKTGDQWVNFALKPDAIDTKYDSDYSFENRIIDAYQDLDSPGQLPPVYGPFGRQKLYRENLETVLGMLGAAEAPLGLLPESAITTTSDYLYSVNPFTAVNYDGIPYYTVELAGVAQGGFKFSENSQAYCTGGSDGTMNNAAFDLLVRNELLTYGEGEYPLLDDAKYPMSAYYDSGFEMDTKMAFCTPMSRRKDVAIILSTHTAGHPQLLPSEESSIAMSLNNMVRNFPESTLYGTAAVRAIICGNSGLLIGHKYRDFMPLSLELCKRFSAYMGSGNGLWRGTASYDQSPNNQVSMFRNVNNRWKPVAARYRDWDNGLVWVEHYDRKALFFPAVQTVYNDDTSVLNSAVNMWIAVDLEKVAQRTWRDLTGSSKFSDDQFIEISNEKISEKVRGRYDERATIVPNTYYTSADKQRGYSWSCDIDMYVGNMKTAGSFTIVARRLSSLTTQP